MEAVEWGKVSQVLDYALELAPEERKAFARRACGEDLELLRSVNDYIDAYEREDLFPVPTHSEKSLIGTQMGAYQLIGEVGRGGMGEVYLAKRTDGDFQLRVAVKVLQGALPGSFLDRRFTTERQILAQLKHPNIVQLLDGGTSEKSNLPYLVMEFVEGIPIDKHCNEQGLDIDGRLRLFLKVCDAVEYAHRNLVVHRDLKPSNILVTQEGEPRLLDFGIARLLAPDLFSRPFDPTLTGSWSLTPRFASPEQIRGGHITVASDVYSLGVVLYELLTDRRPYGYDEMLPLDLMQAVCTEEATSPSRAIGTEGDPSPQVLARTRGVPLEKLKRWLQGDIDNIVLKAIQKEPALRYGSVEQFAEDIRRHLAGLPVLAQPNTWLYTSGKFIQRYKIPVASLAVAALSLLGGSALALWQAHQATISEIKALDASAGALLESHQQLEAQLTALQAAHRLKSLPWPPSDLAKQTRETVQKVGYLSRETNRIQVDSSFLMGLAVAPSGDELVTIGRQVKFWSLDGAPLRTLANTGRVYSIAYSSTGKLFVTSGWDGVLRLFRANDYALINEFKTHNSKVAQVAFSPNGQTLASVGRDGTICFWDVKSGKLLRQVLAHRGGAIAVSYSPSGQLLATGGEDGTIKLWNPQSGRMLKVLTGHTKAIWSLEFSPDGEHLVSASWDKTARLWTREGKLLSTLLGHSSKVWAAHFDQTGHQLVTASEDRTIKVWNVADGSLRETLEGQNSGVNNVVFLNSPGRLASVGEDGTLHFWNTDSPVRILREFPAGLEGVSYSPTEPLIAIASRDNTIRLIKPDGESVGILTGHKNIVYAVAFSPDGKHIASSSEDKTVRIWESSSSSVSQILRRPGQSIIDLAYSPDGRLIAGSGNGKINLWNATGGLSSKVFTGHTGMIKSLAFAPDGKVLASTGDDGTIRLWGMDGQVRILVDHKVAFKSITFSPDGTSLASVGDGGTIYLWNTASGKLLATWRASFHNMTAVHFSPDGRFIAIGDDKGSLSVWRLDGTFIISLYGHIDQIEGLKFSPSGENLISVGYDGRAILWKWATIEQDYSGQICQHLKAYLRYTESIEFQTICTGAIREPPNL